MKSNEKAHPMQKATLPSTTTDQIISTNPSDDFAELGRVNASTKEEINHTIKKARGAFPKWRSLPLQDRMGYCQKLRDAFEKNHEKLAHLTAQEMGQTITLARATVDRAIAYMDWSLSNAEKGLADEISYETTEEINILVKEPHGVGACISPWNFPPSNFVWATFQGLLAGNTIVFKNSEEVQIFAKELENIINNDVKFPDGVFNIIYGEAEAAQTLVAGDIDYINFTGSTRVGQILYKQAAEKFIPATLELGGSDPAIVFADADLDMTIPQLYSARFNNCGQICCSMKRLIVHEDIAETVITGLASLLSSKKLGNALEEDTDIGPLAAKRQQELLIEQVQDAKDKGANIICGGFVPENLKGAYYAPTILTDVTPDMRIWHEEVFGPVLPIVTFKSYDEAIEKANDTIYGLGASVFTRDKTIARQATTDIKSGMCRVNSAHFSKPENPFGGTKLSGIGRENGMIGFDDVTYTRITAYDK